jgi:uncharacterized protein YecE (DUF72 family)
LAVIHLGTSGWSHGDWEGVFYPKQNKDKLAFYSSVFGTVEIDSTFYGYPKKAMMQACARITPEDFVFSAIVPKVVTHDKRLDVARGAGEDLMLFLDDLRPIEESGKLGPVIFQLPQTFKYEDGLGRLIDFVGALPANVKFALEFQNRSWHRPETWDLLRQCQIANVIADAPEPPLAAVVTTDFSVVRWHGRGGKPWTDYRYSGQEIEEWARRVKEIEGHVKAMYGYFGNHFRGNAAVDVLAMMDKLGLANEEQKALGKRVARAIELRTLRFESPSSASSGTGPRGRVLHRNDDVAT